MKKAIAYLLALTLALGLTACGGAGVEPETPNAETPSNTETAAPEETAPSDGESAAPEETASLSDAGSETPAKSAKLSNPFQNYATYAEAAAAAGYGFAAPASVEGYPEVYYSVMDGGDLFQISYRNDGDELTARKGPGAEDISGDYNQYAEERIVDTAALTFTVKGDGEKAFVAFWMDDDNGYSYSLMSRAGMNPEDFEALVVAIQDAEVE